MKLLIWFTLLAFCMIGYSAPYKIGISFEDTTVARWKQERDVLINKIKNEGGQPYFMCADTWPDIQVKQALALVDSIKVDILIIVAADGLKMSKVADYAHSKNVKIIAYDRMLVNCHLDAYISFDNIRIGELIAESALEEIKQGNIIILHGPVKDNNSLLLKMGISQVLLKMGIKKETILFEKHLSEWSESEAFSTLFTYAVDHPNTKINAIICANDQMAAGVISALEMDGRSNVTVVGQDAELEACRRIKNGIQKATIYKPVNIMASLAGTLAMDMAASKLNSYSKTTKSLIENGKMAVPAYLLYEAPIIVNKSNIETYKN